MTEPEVFRNSWRLLAARLVRRSWSALIMVFALWGWVAQLSSPWHHILTVLIGAALVGMAAEPFLIIPFTVLTADSSCLRLRSGALTPTERTCAVAAVSSVQVDEPWDLRLFGLASVTIVAQGVESGSLALAGLPAGEARRLQEIVDGHAASRHDSGLPRSSRDPMPRDPMPRDPMPRDAMPRDAMPRDVMPRDLMSTEQSGPQGRRSVEVSPRVETFPAAATGPQGVSPAPVDGPSPVGIRYAASQHDLVATVLAHGTLVVGAVAVIGFAEDAADLFGLSLTAAAVDSWLALLAFGAAGGLLVGGFAAATFRGMLIESTDERTIRITYGGIERTTHTVRRDQIVAVGYLITPMDMALGTRQLVLSTAQLRHTPMGRIKLPSIRRAEAERLVAELTDRHTAESIPVAPRSWLMAPLGVLAGTLVTTSLLPFDEIWATAAAGICVLLFLNTATRYFTGRLATASAESTFSWRAAGLSWTGKVYAGTCARAVFTRRIPPFPGGNLTVVGFAHRREVMRAPLWSIDSLPLLRGLQIGGPTKSLDGAA